MRPTHLLLALVVLSLAAATLLLGYSSARKRNLREEAVALSDECKSVVQVSSHWLWPTPSNSVSVCYEKRSDGALGIYLGDPISVANAKDRFGKLADRARAIGIEHADIMMFERVNDGLYSSVVQTYPDVNSMARDNPKFK